MTKFHLIIFTALLSLCACSLASAKGNVDLSQGLPLPSVPDSLRAPSLRADYVVKHFWDDMDFSNRKYALDDIFMEQAFANYAQVLPIADADSLPVFVADLLDRAYVSKDAFNKLIDVATLYLYESDSPVYNEDMYRYFVDALLQKPERLDVAQKARVEYRHEMMCKNMAGTAPADFAFVDRAGAERSLHSAIDGVASLVIFYDPDCDDCHRAMSILSAEPDVQALVDAGSLRIIAISDFDTKERWAQTAGALPANWTDGCDVTGIQDQDLYEIRHTPTFYLISTDGKVVLKDKPLGMVLDRLLSSH